MRTLEKEYDVGIITGRFQVHELHEGHGSLIQHVVDRHDKVIIFLGLSGTEQSTYINPLDYESRKQMILEVFPSVNVLYINDHPSDEEWSKNLDKQIKSVVGPNQTALLYGSRDSFISHYSGKYPTQELVPDDAAFYSGTAVRNQIKRSSTRNSKEFREGVIWGVTNRHPIAYQTVDIAIRDRPNGRILLGRKSTDPPGKYRYIGGFSDPESPSLEYDATRETMEETGLEVGNVRYIGSCLIDDWRYRREQDKIKTAFFSVDYIFGHPVPRDDIEELRWFDEDKLNEFNVNEIHLPLLAMMREKG